MRVMVPKLALGIGGKRLPDSPVEHTAPAAAERERNDDSRCIDVEYLVYKKRWNRRIETRCLYLIVVMTLLPIFTCNHLETARWLSVTRIFLIYIIIYEYILLGLIASSVFLWIQSGGTLAWTELIEIGGATPNPAYATGVIAARSTDDS
jgi:hypothetical protein